MKANLFALALATAALAGCATTDATEPVERVEREYVTGSNIPKKSTRESDQPGTVETYGKEAAERARDTSVNTMRPKGAGP